MADKKRTLWRSRFGKLGIYDANTQIIYFEDIAVQAVGLGLTGFVGATGLSWYINPGFFPTPPATEFINQDFLTHLGYWAKIRVHDILPFAYAQDTSKYFEYLNTLQHYKMDYTLYPRVLFGYFVGAMGAIKGVMNVVNNPIQTQIEVHKKGMQLWEGEEAETKLSLAVAKDVKKNGAFTKISNEVELSLKRFFTHFIIFGASGTGKSQFVITTMRDSINAGLKNIILDPKNEFTQMFYKDDGTCAILDPTDLRSLIWDFARDNPSRGLIKKFFAALIPEGKDPMWSNTARAVGVGMLTYLMEEFQDVEGNPNYNWTDMKDCMLSSNEQLLYIMENYYPEALDFIGKLSESGEIEVGKTAESIMINLKAFLGPIIDLARFWYETPEAPRKKISLYKFMTDPDYPIKTIFLKPNELEGEMSNAVIRSVLTYCISLLDSPAITDSNEPRGMFFLDEFHAPGALKTESGQPIIDKLIDRGRSKKWAAVLSSQNIIQLYKIYTREDVDSWRETTSNFILTGAPIGETATKIAEALGEALIDKLHVSLNGSNGSVSVGTNYQEHNKKVIFPSELSHKLEITDTHITYLALFRGLKDAYILTKPFINLPVICPHWIKQPELKTSINKNSRYTQHINEQIAIQADLKKKEQQEKVDLEKPIDDIDEDLINETWVDTGEHAEVMSEEERKFNEENLSDEVSTEMFVESLTDTHSASLVLDVLDKIKDKQAKPHTNSFLQRYQEHTNK